MIKTNTLKSRLKLTLATAIAGGCVANVIAQPMLEEVIITAQKREQGLQEAPISLAVFDQGAIERLGITNVGDIANNVPNLRATTFGVSPTTLRFYIRGIGIADAQVTQDPPVGIYLDNVYLARNTSLTLDVADIERIEVLRGPQGTLYGRNTTGGAINMVTVKPSNEFQFKQLFSFGKYSHLRSKTIANIPLSDTFAAKIAYEHNERDGWIENKGQGDDFNQYDRDAGRIDLRWTPNEDFTLDYSYDRSENDFTANYYQVGELSALAGIILPGVITPSYDRPDKAVLPTRLKNSKDESWGHALTLSYQTGWGELKSITAYRELEQYAYMDYSSNPTVSIFTNDPLDMEHEQFSQELQLIGNSRDNSLEYVAGLYYFSEEGSEVALDTLPLFGLLLPRDVQAENDAIAAYAEVAWTPDGSSPWTLTAGGRYTRDKREASNNIDPKADVTYSNFSPSLMATYALSDEINLYAKVVTGYKSGGYNLRATFFAQDFDEETLTSYEFGWKAELMDRRLRFNGALFFMDYEDLQLNILVPNQPNPTLTQTQNAGEAEISGLEVDLTVAVSESLTASLAYGYLDTEVKKVKGDDASLWDLANSPRHSLSTNINWKVAEFELGQVEYDIDYSWRDDSRTDSRINTGSAIDSYGVLNMRLSLTGQDWFGDGEYTVALWGRNLNDEEYFTDTFGSFNGIHAADIGSYGDPRTYGVDLSYSF